MKNFSDTSANDLDLEQYEQETNWMKLAEAAEQDLIVMSANKGETKYGWKYFIHASISGDPEAVEYTISVSQQSAIYAQLETIAASEGNNAFPFRCTVKQVGRTYRLADSSERAVPKRPSKPPFFQAPKAE